MRNTLEELTQVFSYLGPGEEPVIAVTSSYHTRRVGLVWRRVAAGSRPLLLTAARGEAFDPNRWWSNRDHVLSLIREYLGLAAFLAGASSR